MCRAYFEAPHTCQTIAALQDRQHRFEEYVKDKDA
jgi:hypothetical protein